MGAWGKDRGRDRDSDLWRHGVNREEGGGMVVTDICLSVTERCGVRSVMTEEKHLSQR